MASKLLEVQRSSEDSSGEDTDEMVEKAQQLLHHDRSSRDRLPSEVVSDDDGTMRWQRENHVRASCKAMLLRVRAELAKTRQLKEGMNILQRSWLHNVCAFYV